MKQIFALILTCLLLCGCAAEAPQEETAATAATQATEPAGLYAPDSALEVETGGAVRCYPLSNGDGTDVMPLGEDLLVISYTETDTALTVLSGDTLYPAATLALDGVLADPLSARVSGSGLSFFDCEAMETVVLDSSLREIRRIHAPEDLNGTPLLSADRSTLYYCTSDSLRALELDTGISRVLKEMHFPCQAVTGLFLNDTVLECTTSDGENTEILYISTENGQLVGGALEAPELSTSAEHYYAITYEGAYQVLQFGSIEGESTVLSPKGAYTSCHFLPEDHAAVVTRQAGDSQLLLDYYDLDTGLRAASLELTTDLYPWSFVSVRDGELYFLYYDESSGCNVLCRWDTSASPTGDQTVYTGPRYTRSEPDTEGLAACSLYAREISDHYGVEVLVYQDAVEVQPWDYDLEAEYLVPVLQQELEALDAHLSNYPDGFLRTLSECFGGIRICLVRGITGSAESGSLDTANGIQFWDDDYVAYLALAAGQETEHTLYHELCHLIDTKVFNECRAYDSWEELNPDGFEYDYDYIANLNRDSEEYLAERRYFIDTYSMSYPKEDRARIMEYAMTPGNADYFQSTPMQAKLLTLCQGIREAFGLKKSSETFLWEQYLNLSLAYTE